MIVTNKRIYQRCTICGKLVRLNKPVFMSLHFCLPPEQREAVLRRRFSGRGSSYYFDIGCEITDATESNEAHGAGGVPGGQ